MRPFVGGGIEDIRKAPCARCRRVVEMRGKQINCDACSMALARERNIESGRRHRERMRRRKGAA